MPDHVKRKQGVSAFVRAAGNEHTEQTGAEFGRRLKGLFA
jgi:hypothetical protein